MLNSWRGVIRVACVRGLWMLLGLSMPLAAAPTLDTSFGTSGTLIQLFSPDGSLFAPGGQVHSVYAKRDGNILVYGLYISGHSGLGLPFYSYTLAQYSAEGLLDPGFGSSGFVPTSGAAPTAFNPLVQRDDRIVSVGTTGLMRLNSDGSPEQGFITDGAASLDWFSQAQWTSLAQQADGKVVVAGQAYPALALARFNTDGTLDLAFNNSGGVIIPLGQSITDSLAGLTIQPDGKIVVSGNSTFSTGAGLQYYGISLYRYNFDGTPDATFGDNGRTTATGSNTLGFYGTYASGGVVIQPNGRLIVYGLETGSTASTPTPTNVLILGFTPTGTPDRSFGLAGAIRIYIGGGTRAQNAVVQPDGKLLVNIYANDAAENRILRFDADGSIDTTFGSAGILTSRDLPIVNTLALQADGNLLLGGGASSSPYRYPVFFALQRYISGPMAAIEYYNASLNHYFLSMNPQEARDLDLGVRSGWARTGLSFPTYGSAAAAAGTSANPVCRFYIPPQHGDSHFFSADPVECAIALGKIDIDPNFSGYVEETPNAFYIDLPDKATGACPADTTPVYRLWNQAPASNHRYTTSVVIKNQMVAHGWVAEGYGLTAVNMCAPK